MRISIAAAVGAATAGLVTGLALAPVAAQAPAEPPKPAPAAIPDKIPFGLPYGMAIGLDRARNVIAAAEAEATRRGWPMAIAVVDTHGDLVGFARMDGSQLVATTVSQRKARTAARWRRETRVFFNAYAGGSTTFGTLDPDLAATPGGIPLVSDGHVVGAIGCSGGTGEQDALICGAGADAIK